MQSIQQCFYNQNIILQGKIAMQEGSRLNLQRQTIGHSKLRQVVSVWFKDHWSQLGRDIKASTSKIKEIKGQFHEKCVEYILLRKLFWIIKDYKEEIIIDLNTFLKRTYQQLIINGFFNAENTFQLFIYYYVKVVSSFLRHHFNNLLIDTQLEAENFIVLYYTFLGIEISEGTFETIERKYLKVKFKKIKASSNQKIFKSTKNSFFQTFLKQPNKLHGNKFQKSQHLIHNSHQSICKQIKSSVLKDHNQNDIRSILKEHLYVNPLPPIKQNKIRINEIQRLKTEPNIAENTFQASPQRQSMHEQPKKQRAMHVYSNQLSNSLKSLHPEQFFFELASKKVKINRSFYQFKETNLTNPRLQISQRKQQLNNSLHKKQNECQKMEHRKSTQWLQIVGSIKKKVFQIRHNGIDSTKNINYSQVEESIVSDELSKVDNEAANMQQNIKPNSQPQSSHLKAKKDEDSKRETKLHFVKSQTKQINQSIKIQSYPQDNRSFNDTFFKPINILQKNHRVIRNSIRQEHYKFMNSCKIRMNSIEQQQKYRLNERWIGHCYKQ